MKHILYTETDEVVPKFICDKEGSVVLDCCKICGRRKVELLLNDGECPGYEKEIGPQELELEQEDPDFNIFTGTPIASSLNTDTAPPRKTFFNGFNLKDNPSVREKITAMNDLMLWFGIADWKIEKKGNVISIRGYCLLSEEPNKEEFTKYQIDKKVLRIIKKFPKSKSMFNLSEIQVVTPFTLEEVKYAVRRLISQEKINVRKIEPGVYEFR